MSPAAHEVAVSKRERLEGPLLTIAVVVLTELLAHSSFRLPNPPAWLLLAIVFSAFRGGRSAGWMSAVVAWTYCLYFFAQSVYPLSCHPDDLRRVVIWAIAMPVTAAMVGTLRHRAVRESLRAARTDAEERLRLAVRASNLAVWEWEIATGRIAWDERTYELFDATPESFDNSFEGFTCRLPVEHRARVEAEIALSVETGVLYQTEFPILLPSERSPAEAMGIGWLDAVPSSRPSASPAPTCSPGRIGGTRSARY